MVSLSHEMLFDSISLTVELLSKLEPVLSNPAAAALSTKCMEHSKSFAVISTSFTASSAGAESIWRNHVLCSAARSSPHPIASCHEIVQRHPPSAPTCSPGSLAVSATSAVTASTDAPSPQSHPQGWESTSAKRLQTWIF